MMMTYSLADPDKRVYGENRLLSDRLIKINLFVQKRSVDRIPKRIAHLI